MAFNATTTEGRAALDWLRRRKASLERARQPHEAKWREVMQYFEPTYGRSIDWQEDMNAKHGVRGDERIFNSHVRHLVERLSAGLHSGITNPAREWFRLAPRNKSGRTSSGREYLGRATEALQGAMAGSNVYPALDQMYGQLAVFGTAAALLVPDDETVMRLIVLDAGAYWVSENRRDVVDTLLRRTSYTVEQIAQEYGVENLSGQVRDLHERGELDRPMTVWNYIAPFDAVPEAFRAELPQGDDAPQFVSVHFIPGGVFSGVGEMNVLAVRGFWYCPILCPRWRALPGSAYGVGVCEVALGDSKELQALEVAKMRLVENEADPAMAAPESMRGKPIDTGPGGLTFYTELLGAGGMGGNIPVQRLFETRESIEVVLKAIEDLTYRLDRECYADLFAMMINLDARQGSREMTAAEVSELANEKVTLLGPILMRLNSGLLDPLVNAAFAICFDRAQDELEMTGEDRTGLTDYPEGLLGEDFSIEYQSSIHVAQQSATRLNGLVQLQQYAAGLMQIDPQVIDALDTDKMMQIGAEAMHEFGCVRAPKDIQTIREGRAAQQEQQMRMAQEAQALDAEKARSEIAKNIAQTQQAAGANAFRQGGLVA